MDEKKETYQDKLKRQFQPWEDYTNMAHHWRGLVINQAIDLEQAAEDFIAKHYVLGRTKEVYEERLLHFKQTFFWITNMGFGDKLKILKAVINKCHPEFLQLEHLQEYNTELDEIIRCRNNMAHWLLDFSSPYRWEGAKNRKFKVNKLTGHEMVYGEAEINRIVELARKYSTTLWHWGYIPFEDVLSP